jgi:hypothetical protein
MSPASLHRRAHQHCPLPCPAAQPGASGAMRLCRAAGESLAQLLAAAWAAGQHSGGKSLVELPQPGRTEAEQQVVVLTIGRLACLLSSDTSFTRMVVLMLSEALVAPAAHLSPQAYGTIATTLAAVAAACVEAAGGKHCWEYDQVLQLLLRLYQQPSEPVRPLLYGGGGGSCAGMLARALEGLAAGGPLLCLLPGCTSTALSVSVYCSGACVGMLLDSMVVVDK